MNVDPDIIAEFVRNRELVSIERSDFDTRTLQAFPIALSESLLAVRYVFDFHIDGLLFLRRDTITDVTVNATDRFQRKLLENCGEVTPELFSISHTIDSFASLLAGLPTNKIVIVEEESLEDDSRFWIGRYVWGEDGKHRIHEFTGAGNWDDDLTELDLATITCCQLDSNYIRHYQRYFDSRGFPGIPG